jgi:hypothetical protein
MPASKSLLACFALLLLIALYPHPVRASDSPPDAPLEILRVVLTNGDTLQARCVQASPFDMVAVTPTDQAEPRYVPHVHIRAILDGAGRDRTEGVLERHETLGTPIPREIHVGSHRSVRVGPRSVTSSFLITETSILGRINTGPDRDVSRAADFSFDLAVMQNVSDRMSLGYGVFVGSGGSDGHLGARLRLRRWLSPTSGVEIAPGIILAEHPTEVRDDILPSYSLQASWFLSRYLTLTAEGYTLRRLEYRHRGILAYGPSDDVNESGVLIGAKLGQWPGLVGGVLVGFLSLFEGSIHAQTAPAIP